MATMRIKFPGKWCTYFSSHHTANDRPVTDYVTGNILVPSYCDDAAVVGVPSYSDDEAQMNRSFYDLHSNSIFFNLVDTLLLFRDKREKASSAFTSVLRRKFRHHRPIVTMWSASL